MQAVHPRRILPLNLRILGNRLLIGGEEVSVPPGGRIRVIAVGKAAATMGMVAESILGDALHDGVVVSKQPPERPFQRLEALTGGHPIPTAASLAAGERVLRTFADSRPEDLVLVFVSGGGSALLEHLVPGVTLEDLVATNEAMLSNDVPIQTMNRVRRRLSRVKGGGLKVALRPARVRSFVLSDVPGNDLATIASGPTVPADATLSPEERDRVDDLLSTLPATVRDILASDTGNGTNGQSAPTSLHPEARLIGTADLALEGAREAATALGYEAYVETSPVIGECGERARALLDGFRVLLTAKPDARRLCLFAAGETTLDVTGDGFGGRNQHCVLEAINNLRFYEGKLTIFSAGTDGEDGPTNAAGARAMLRHRLQAEEAGDAVEGYLRQHDSYRFFERYGGHIRTGPTGTNVADIMGIFYEAEAADS